MTVIDNLLIASPTLQNALVDKFGNPLVNGVVNYSRTQLGQPLKIGIMKRDLPDHIHL